MKHLSVNSLTIMRDKKMKYLKCSLYAMALLVVCAQALAVNKCTSADGKVSFQDAPCMGGKSEFTGAKSSSGIAPQTNNATPSKPQSEAQRLEAQVDASVKERRLYDLENVNYPVSMKLLEQHRRDCESEQVRLKAGQFAYVQNLYGKTHAAQIASEMAAASARCDLKDRQLKEQVDSVRAECLKFGGCKQ